MNPPRENLVLFGFMGSGKSAVARALCQLFHMKVVDTDQMVEGRVGMTPGEVIRSQGEARFRELEREAVRDASRLRGTVVATGGGVPLDPANMEALSASGILVFLSASPRTLARRLKDEADDRPLLPGTDEESIRDKLAERREAYAHIPHRVDTDGRQVEDVAREVYGIYLRHARRRG